MRTPPTQSTVTFWSAVQLWPPPNWLSFGLVVPFLVAGVILSLARLRVEVAPGTPGPGLLLLVAALYSLVHLATWTLIRYRLPVDAVMMPFVALSIVSTVQ